MLAEAYVKKQSACVARRELRQRRGRSPGKRDFKDTKTLKQSDEDTSDRAERIRRSKAKSKCRDCGEIGHWSGDFVCKNRGKSARKDRSRQSDRSRSRRDGRGRGRGQGGTRRGYFAVRERDEDQADRVCCMAVRDPGGPPRSYHPPGGGGEPPTAAAPATPITPTPQPTQQVLTAVNEASQMMTAAAARMGAVADATP